jgi:hypothetical protein
LGACWFTSTTAPAATRAAGSTQRCPSTVTRPSLQRLRARDQENAGLLANHRGKSWKWERSLIFANCKTRQMSDKSDSEGPRPTAILPHRSPGVRHVQRSDASPVTVCGHVVPNATHICAFFDSENQEYDCVVPYFVEGLDRASRW